MIALNPYKLQVVEEFEAFLDEKGIILNNPEKSEDENASNIYGGDFDELMDKVTDPLKDLAEACGETDILEDSWEIVSQESPDDACSCIPAKFQAGDIVRDTRSVARYIVTGIHRYSSGKLCWTGIAKNGASQGGSIMGNENFDDYEVIGHFNIRPMYRAIEDAWHKWYFDQYGKECTWS